MHDRYGNPPPPQLGRDEQLATSQGGAVFYRDPEEVTPQMAERMRREAIEQQVADLSRQLDTEDTNLRARLDQGAPSRWEQQYVEQVDPNVPRDERGQVQVPQQQRQEYDQRQQTVPLPMNAYSTAPNVQGSSPEELAYRQWLMKLREGGGFI